MDNGELGGGQMVKEAFTRASVNLNNRVSDPTIKEFGLCSLGGYLVGLLVWLRLYKLALISGAFLTLVGIVPNLQRIRRDLEAIGRDGIGATAVFSKDMVRVCGALAGLILCTLSIRKQATMLATTGICFAAGF